MTAPEREALVSQLKYSAGADESEAHGLRRTSLNTQRALDLEMQATLKRNAAAAIEALSSPAVTVTEEMVMRALEGFDTGIGNPNDYRRRMRAALEAVAISPRKNERDAAMQSAFDILEAAPELNMSNYGHDQVDALNKAMIEAFLLLKPIFSTTPQTGSQE